MNRAAIFGTSGVMVLNRLCVCPVYDVLTGAVVSRLSGHDACVRDVSWHPYEDNIVSSSVSPPPMCTRVTAHKYRSGNNKEGFNGN